MKRIEQLRAWLFPLGVILFAVLLLFSLTSPRVALLSCFGGAALLSAFLWALSVSLCGGRALRELLIRGLSLLAQTEPRRLELSPEDDTLLREQRLALLKCLMDKEPAELKQAADALEQTARRFTPPSSALRELFVVLAIAFLLASLLKTFIVEPFHIPSGSMYPTLHVGDHIFVNKFIYGVPLPGTKTKLLSGINLPKRGEVIVFRREEDTDYIKRVIAIPGDVVDVTMDEISINGFKLDREYEGELSWRELEPMTKKYEPRASNRFREHSGSSVYTVIYDNPPNIMPSRHFVVPPGEYMVLGDNRDHSFDSLHWGFVPLEDIQGRAMFIVGSIEDGNFVWGRFGIPIW